MMSLRFVYTLLIIVCSHIAVNAQIVDIPDTNFKNRLKFINCADFDGDGILDGDVDTNNDGEIQISEAEAVIGLKISEIGDSIESIQGIEAFTNLISLNLRSGLLNVDLSGNINLEVVELTNNELTQVSFIGNPNLKEIDLSSNFDLTDVDISQNNLLERFTCNSCYYLSGIDVTQNINLKALTIEGGDMTSLDLTQNINLEELDLDSNYLLTALDLSQNINLKTLIMNDSNCNPLDISQNINLEILDLEIHSIYATNLTNPLTSINVTQNTNLMSLNLEELLITDLDVSNNQQLEELNVRNTALSSINITQNPNLKTFDCNNTELTELDLSASVNLETLIANHLDLTELDVSSSVNLENLQVANNDLTALDITNNPNLEYLEISGNSISDMDFSNSNELRHMSFGGNSFTTLDLRNTKITTLSSAGQTTPSLTDLYIKNGIISNSSWDYPGIWTYDIEISNCSNLQYVCADLGEEDAINTNNVEINALCSFTPGGEFYSVDGENRFDNEQDGCDVTDEFFPNLKFNISNDNVNGDYISDSSGNYQINLQSGDYTIVPVLENPEYFEVSPASVTVDLPTDGNSVMQNFCLTANEIFNDLEIIIIPLEEAIPGFDSTYKIVYKNNGNSTLSGTVELDYSISSDFITYLSSNPTENINSNTVLTWNFTDLTPFEERDITFNFNLNTPTDPNFPLNSGSLLYFESVVSSGDTDQTPDNNEFALYQTVVNSFDPNDIRCLEGENILPERVGEYVHYLIRFENVGTANATNIMVENTIDVTKFDVSSLIPIDGSHEFFTRVYEGNKVKFIFENINLPFDDANNDGYVVFKIKTLDTLVLGDTFSNQAEIYFDFNAPIITNTYTTEVSEEQLSANEFNKLNTRVYPNPVTNNLTIESDVVLESAAVYDINGRAILNANFDTDSYTLDLSQLNAGLYFLKVFSSSGSETLKVVKR